MEVTMYLNVLILRLCNFTAKKLKRGSSYIDSPKWIFNKKASINPQNTKDNYCFAYSIIGALNHEDISHHPEISNLRPYISNYNMKDINFPAEQKD